MKIFLLLFAIIFISAATHSMAQAVFTVDSLDFGVCKKDTHYIKPLIIRNTGNAPGTIKACVVEFDTRFSLEKTPDFPLVLEPGKELSLDILFKTYDVYGGGKCTAEVGIQTDKGWKFTQIFGMVPIQSRSIITYPPEFNNINIGKEQVKDVVIHNKMGYSLIIDSIELSTDSRFSVVGDFIDTVIHDEEKLHIPIRFFSDKAGIFKDVILINMRGDGDYFIDLPLEAAVQAGTGIERVYDPSFNIAPNPATGFTTINLPPFKSQNPLLKIYDALGNEVADCTGKVTGGYASFTYDTRALPNGAYFVRFTDGKYTLIRTFIVNN